jgi:hypothetical protein
VFVVVVVVVIDTEEDCCIVCKILHRVALCDVKYHLLFRICCAFFVFVVVVVIDTEEDCCIICKILHRVAICDVKYQMVVIAVVNNNSSSVTIKTVQQPLTFLLLQL